MLPLLYCAAHTCESNRIQTMDTVNEIKGKEDDSKRDGVVHSKNNTKDEFILNSTMSNSTPKTAKGKIENENDNGQVSPCFPAISKTEKEKKKLIDYILEIPDIQTKEGQEEINRDDESSKFSSPFDSRVDTAATNITFQKQHENILHRDKSKDVRIDLPGTESEENFSFFSSPCVSKKAKDSHKAPKKRKFEGGRGSVNNKRPLPKAAREVDSMDAINGSDENSDKEEAGLIQTPLPYIIDEKPIYEYMEGEDSVYYDILGKKDRNESLDENERQFLDYIHMNFDQWYEESGRFAKEYDVLTKKVILARLKFDRRIHFLRKSLDTFALNLEKYGEEIHKRSEILKEYCERIVTEVDQ